MLFLCIRNEQASHLDLQLDFSRSVSQTTFHWRLEDQFELVSPSEHQNSWFPSCPVHVKNVAPRR